MVITFLATLIAASAATAPLTLSQKDVAEMVLRQGLRAKEVGYEYEQKRLTVLERQSVLNWSVTLQSGLDSDRRQTLSNSTNDSRTQQMQTSLEVKKSLLTGTALTFSMNRISQKTDNLAIPPDLVQDGYELALEQALWGNFFGVGTRASIRQAEANYRGDIIQRANALEDVVMDALIAFWNAYVAQENFRAAIAARDRYEKLVAAVRRKTSVGYANPGELSQAQAEYEQKIQTVKTASVAYLRQLDTFLTLLNIDPGTEINFSVPKQLPPVPKLGDKSIEDLRIVRAQSEYVKGARDAVTVAESDRKPKLDLVAKAGASGVDDSAERSYAELTSSGYPHTFIGLRFTHSFGSEASSERVRARKAELALTETRLERIRAEQRDLAADAERQVGATHAVAVSAARERNFRDRAVQELTRTYNQGRTDIRNLIEAINRLFDAEVTVIRSLGNYQIALNNWAALRDELIPDSKEEAP